MVKKIEPIKRLIFTPATALVEDVNSFWILEGAQSVYRQNLILPDSYVDLIINCGAPLCMQMQSGAYSELPRVYVGHLQTQVKRLRPMGRTKILAMRLYPWALAGLLRNETACRYQDIAALNDSWQKLAAAELHQKMAASQYTEAVATLQQFVCDRRVNLSFSARAVKTAGRLIYDYSGQMSAEVLARKSALSLRQLERRFKYFTGVSPKTYARLVRFERFCHMLGENPHSNFALSAAQLGYSDQAHLSHEVKLFCGVTPTDLVARIWAYTSQAQDDDFLQDT